MISEHDAPLRNRTAIELGPESTALPTRTTTVQITKPPQIHSRGHLLNLVVDTQDMRVRTVKFAYTELTRQIRTGLSKVGTKATQEGTYETHAPA